MDMLGGEASPHTGQWVLNPPMFNGNDPEQEENEDGEPHAKR